MDSGKTSGSNTWFQHFILSTEIIVSSTFSYFGGDEISFGKQ